jgi:hypothetical protein
MTKLAGRALVRQAQTPAFVIVGLDPTTHTEALPSPLRVRMPL